jgi:acetate kinase
MGMTPREGLIMGTRCGDVDPALHFYLARKTGKSFDAIEDILNKESGLKGICGMNDMREIERSAEAGDVRAEFAIEMFCYRIKKYIGAFYAVLGRVDAIIFTGGIGENSARIRRESCEDLDALGISLDERRNKAIPLGGLEIQDGGSCVKVLVIPTDEEREIARQTIQTIRTAGGASEVSKPCAP